MTRCMHCGAERAAELCENCGLTPAVAEVVLRRNLLVLTAVFLVGAVLFVPASRIYPPLDLDGVLIFVGGLFFVTLSLAMWLDTLARRHGEVEAWKRIFRALVPVPWLLSGLLIVNGWMDRSPPSVHTATVVSKFSMPGWLQQHRLVVSSWRAGRLLERIAVDASDQSRFLKGDEIEIGVHEGLAGIAWVSDVHRKH